MNNYKIELLKNIIQENISLKHKYNCIRNYYATMILECYKNPNYNDNYKTFYDYINNHTCGVVLGRPKDIISTETIYMEHLINYSIHTIDMLKYYHGTMLRKIIEKHNIPCDIFHSIIEFII